MQLCGIQLYGIMGWENIRYPRQIAEAVTCIGESSIISITNDETQNTLRGAICNVCHTENDSYFTTCIHGCIDPEEQICSIDCLRKHWRAFHPNDNEMLITRSFDDPMDDEECMHKSKKQKTNVSKDFIKMTGEKESSIDDVD